MPELHKAGVAFIISIVNFFFQSHGFTKFYNQLYAYWKCTPLLILISFVAVHGGNIPLKRRAMLAVALTAGCAGDYLIGLSLEGIVPGAMAFGVGHALYLALFVNETKRVHNGVAVALTAWSGVLGVVCIIPMLKVSIIAVVVLSIYSVFLSATLLYSFSQYVYGSTIHEAGSPPLFWRLLGFSLFYLSDTVLILAHTGLRIPLAEPIILFSYFAAQYLIVRAEVSSAFYQSNTDSKKSN